MIKKHSDEQAYNESEDSLRSNDIMIPKGHLVDPDMRAALSARRAELKESLIIDEGRDSSIKINEPMHKFNVDNNGQFFKLPASKIAGICPLSDISYSIAEGNNDNYILIGNLNGTKTEEEDFHISVGYNNNLYICNYNGCVVSSAQCLYETLFTDADFKTVIMSVEDLLSFKITAETKFIEQHKIKFVEELFYAYWYYCVNIESSSESDEIKSIERLVKKLNTGWKLTVNSLDEIVLQRNILAPINVDPIEFLHENTFNFISLDENIECPKTEHRYIQINEVIGKRKLAHKNAFCLNYSDIIERLFAIDDDQTLQTELYQVVSKFISNRNKFHFNVEDLLCNNKGITDASELYEAYNRIRRTRRNTLSSEKPTLDTTLLHYLKLIKELETKHQSSIAVNELTANEYGKKDSVLYGEYGNYAIYQPIHGDKIWEEFIRALKVKIDSGVQIKIHKQGEILCGDSIVGSIVANGYIMDKMDKEERQRKKREELKQRLIIDKNLNAIPVPIPTP